MKIAITGGIGSGKSLVLELIKAKGYPVFSCDEIYRRLTENEGYLAVLRREFPCVFENGFFDKKKLSSIVFSDSEKLKKLNGIAHPIIMQTLLRQMEESNSEKTFAEVPLLFEGNFADLFDKIIVVYRPLEDRIQSIIKRDSCNRAQALQRIANQFDYESNFPKLTEKHFILQNEESIELLSNKLNNILEKL